MSYDNETDVHKACRCINGKCFHYLPGWDCNCDRGEFKKRCCENMTHCGAKDMEELIKLRGF